MDFVLFSQFFGSANRQLLRFFPLLFLGLSLTGCNVSISITGNGAGQVESTPNGINCSNLETTCKLSFQDSEIILTATPEEDSIFIGWSGACEGSEPTCSVSYGMRHQVSAQFKRLEKAQLNCDTEAAKAECLTPQFSDEYYIEQSILYFRTMESSVSPFLIPEYSPLVARWEWPPWLLLTGFGRFNMIWTDILLKLNPTKYASIDCRAFPTQPFGRCYVVFDYSGELCPIYEEFTFNDQGEITFIEAWTDQPGYLPMPEDDPWAEGDEVNRLATRVPGLGNAEGLIDLESNWMLAAQAKDADLAEFIKRAKNPYESWIIELLTNFDALSKGCHPDA